jgi:uncharacterized cupredoxin-like copper-binding protein
MPRPMPTTRLCLAAVVLVALGAVVFGVPSLGATVHKPATVVTVTATEFKFKLSRKTVPHGKVVFTLVDKGKLAHNFWIGGKRTPLVSPGKRAKLTVTLKAGKQTYLCTVPGHAAAGMKGTLVVR